MKYNFVNDELYFSEFLVNIDNFQFVSWRQGDKEHLDGKSTVLVGSWTDKLTEIITASNPKTVFCNSNSKKINLKQVTIPYVVADDISCETKNIELSFMGWNQGAIRNRLFEIYKDNRYVISTEDFFWDNPNTENRQKYIEILSKTQFSLCPRGVGSGTYRFWESLKAGAIPILISDEYDLPLDWDWESTILRVPESDLRFNFKIDSLINKNNYRQDSMREKCLECYSHFSDKNTVKQYIQKYS